MTGDKPHTIYILNHQPAFQGRQADTLTHKKTVK